MKALEANPKTGFLESNRGSSFTSELKIRFLELADQACQRGEFPDIEAICKTIGISPWSFYHHKSIDEKFAEEWELAMRKIETTLVRTMVAQGQKPKGYMDRITWLRKHFPKEWNPNQQLNISMDLTATKSLLSARPTVIDAEIVP